MCDWRKVCLEKGMTRERHDWRKAGLEKGMTGERYD